MAKRTAIGYKSYVFRTKDPEIDRLRTLICKEKGKLNSRVLSEIEKDSGVTASCQKAWFFGVTRKPQNATLEAVGRSMGYRRTWQPMKRGKS